ncbi:putative PEP-binding protein [Symbiopectobacterium sp. RP]|uniref:putative PEP-binding protein n=1 Tax=Symbiopectobacterium sp. RP TaxID=3248553 RepID=UPI003D26F4D8
MITQKFYLFNKAYDSLHPSMLQALAGIARECQRLDLEVSVCGEMAGEAMGSLVLTGLGYRTFSMNGRSVARVKYLLRQLVLTEVQALAQHLLAARSASEVRQWIALFLEERGLRALARGGR